MAKLPAKIKPEILSISDSSLMLGLHKAKFKEIRIFFSVDRSIRIHDAEFRVDELGFLGIHQQGQVASCFDTLVDGSIREVRIDNVHSPDRTAIVMVQLDDVESPDKKKRIKAFWF